MTNKLSLSVFLFTTLDGSANEESVFLDNVILIHSTCALAAGDLSEEGGVRRRHGISGWPEAGRGRRGSV